MLEFAGWVAPARRLEHHCADRSPLSCFGAAEAFTGILQLFFGGDELSFTVRTTSPLVTNPARHYTRISDAAQEVVDARIYLGIHFRFADEEGRRLGNRVAHWTFMKFLRPVDAD